MYNTLEYNMRIIKHRLYNTLIISKVISRVKNKKFKKRQSHTTLKIQQTYNTFI